MSTWLLFICKILIIILHNVFANTDETSIWRFEVTLPEFLEEFLDGKSTMQWKAGSEENDDKFRLKVSGPGVQTLRNIIEMVSRKSISRPGVEIGPGAFKTEIVTYPPNKFINDLKKLIRLKQKMENNKKLI